jgi:hypothetical protein
MTARDPTADFLKPLTCAPQIGVGANVARGWERADTGGTACSGEVTNMRSRTAVLAAMLAIASLGATGESVHRTARIREPQPINLQADVLKYNF